MRSLYSYDLCKKWPEGEAYVNFNKRVNWILYRSRKQTELQEVLDAVLVKTELVDG